MTLTTTLDKIKRLEQYVTVQEIGSPVLALALDKLLKREISYLQGMKRELKSDLLSFEIKYGVDSQSFYRQYEAGKLGDQMDFVEWSASVEMADNLDHQIHLLQNDNRLRSSH